MYIVVLKTGIENLYLESFLTGPSYIHTHAYHITTERMCEIEAEDLHINPQAGNKDIKLQIAWVLRSQSLLKWPISSLKATTLLSTQTEAATWDQIFRMPQASH